MKKKTAMQNAIEILRDLSGKYENRIPSAILWEELIKLLEKEKQQIIEAVYDGMGTNFDPNMGRAKLYYNEKYGG